MRLADGLVALNRWMAIRAPQRRRGRPEGRPRHRIVRLLSAQTCRQGLLVHVDRQDCDAVNRAVDCAVVITPIWLDVKI